MGSYKGSHGLIRAPLATGIHLQRSAPRLTPSNEEALLGSEEKDWLQTSQQDRPARQGWNEASSWTATRRESFDGPRAWCCAPGPTADQETTTVEKEVDATRPHAGR
jgi:hypothetical protein